LLALSLPNVLVSVLATTIIVRAHTHTRSSL
jgi:hypothetical protein